MAQQSVADRVKGAGPDQPLQHGCARLPSVSSSAWRSMSCARRRISDAARRVKVSSRMRAGSTPCMTSHATRCAMVLVLPVPAPATTSNGPGAHALPVGQRLAVGDGLALRRIECG
jgi:hypothetical protein